jgi:hypothetical protein
MTESIAKIKLEQIIERGIRQAGPVIERVLASVTTDRVMNARAIRDVLEVRPDGSIHFDRPTHSHAASQFVARVGLPASYVSDLSVADSRGVDNSWRRELLGHTLRELLAHSPERYLVREQDGQIRGVLSDRFRRLDTRPLLDAFIGAASELGMVPYEGISSDLSTSIRAISPTIYEPLPGEYMVRGIAQTNSDFGARSYSITEFGIRLVCLNGMTGESVLKQVHLGGRLPDNLELSEATYQHDTRTMVSATADVVRALLAPARVSAQMDRITESGSAEIDVKAELRRMKGLSKSEADAVKRAFESPEVEMLPAGKSMWRFSNALSWCAHQAQPERRLELEAMAGSVLAA